MGKSTMVSNIGAILSQKNYSVGFIDADLGGANLHLCLGVKRPKHNLQDFLSGRIKDIEGIAEKTIVPNSWLISGASDVLELANPHFAQKQKLIARINRMNADYVLIDLGAGTNTQVTDFFIAFNNGIVVSDGLPTSIENAYGFLKNGIIRGITRLFPGRKDLRDYFKRFSDSRHENGFATVDEMLAFLNNEHPQESCQIKEWLAHRKTFLILNMVKHRNDISVGKKFADIIKKYLHIHINQLGYIIDEPEMRRSMRAMKPLVIDAPPPRTLACFEAVSEYIIALTKDRGDTL